ncbi:MAG: toll/interleukin-1 receptor domain-containing protein [Magnetococcales bacterium]|nr:toll/interleukin-1 receptor domain-containing protein [Magnetococcales bacterium]
MYEILISIEIPDHNDELKLISILEDKNIIFEFVDNDCEEFYIKCADKKPSIIIVDSMFIIENWNINLNPNPCVIFISNQRESINKIPEHFHNSIEIIQFDVNKLVNTIENMVKQKKCCPKFLNLLTHVRREHDSNKYLTELIVELLKSTEGYTIDVDPSNDSEYEYDVFISHSSKDNEFVKELANRLSGNYINVWYDELIVTGDNIVVTINEKLDRCRKLLVIVSENSKNSDWVQSEVGHLIMKDPKNKEKRLIVLNIDNHRLSGIGGDIAGICYEKEKDSDGFAKLLEECNGKRKYYKAYCTLNNYGRKLKKNILLECWHTKKSSAVGINVVNDMKRRIIESDGCYYGILVSWEGFTADAELEIARFAVEKQNTKQIIIPIKGEDIEDIFKKNYDFKEIINKNRDKILHDALKT